MSVSGLSKCERAIARDRAVHAAMLGLHHAPAIHYTQGAQRWEGIAQRKVARRGDFPTHADCSAFWSWCLWNGVELPFQVGDIVNGQRWLAGFTGTLAQHGRQVIHARNILNADLVLYGTGPTYQHVAGVVGERNGKPLVVSHGSEGGPYLLPIDYRSDIGQIRRYI